MLVAVVGHVESCEFARVARPPVAGEIVHASRTWREAAGGGAVAAVQVARLEGSALFLTALGDDELGSASLVELEGRGLDVHAARRAEPTRRAFVHVDDAGERTITVLGARMVPHGGDDLPWGRLADASGVYFTGGDTAALRACRAARVLVATPRAADTLLGSGVQLDVLVRSGSDAGEALDPARLDPPPRMVVTTAGAAGGEWACADGRTGRWEAAPLPGPVADCYGCGDSFAAGMTVALARGQDIAEATRLGARCGAACLTGAGPYAAQLSA